MIEEALKDDVDEDEEIEQDQYLVFTVRSQEFGVQAMRIQEITAMMDIAEVPNAPDYIEGLLNLRGRLVSAINFRKRFGFKTQAHDEDTRIIIMEHLGFPVGIIVDVVDEVIKIPDNKVQQLPPTATSSLPDGYITGIGMLDGRLVILLDADKVFSKIDHIQPDILKKAVDDVQLMQNGESEKTAPLAAVVKKEL